MGTATRWCAGATQVASGDVPEAVIADGTGALTVSRWGSAQTLGAGASRLNGDVFSAGSAPEM